LLDVLRQAFKFALRKDISQGQLNFSDSLILALRMVSVFEAFEQEGSMCKAMAAVIIIKLTMRDVIGADQLYLQEYLSNKPFIQSKECQVVDKLLLAFKNHDIDALEEATRGQGLFCLDLEVQSLAKRLSLFSDRAKDAREFRENEDLSRALQELSIGASASSSSSSFASPSTSSSAAALVSHQSDAGEDGSASLPPAPKASGSVLTTAAPPAPPVSATSDFDEDDEDEVDLS